MARDWEAANASCSSSEAESFPASCVVMQSKPRWTRSSANRVITCRSRYRRMKSASSLFKVGMGLLFLPDQGVDFIPMVRVIAQRVKHLPLGQAQCFSNAKQTLALLMKRYNVPHRNP